VDSVTYSIVLLGLLGGRRGRRLSIPRHSLLLLYGSILGSGSDRLVSAGDITELLLVVQNLLQAGHQVALQPGVVRTTCSQLRLQLRHLQLARINLLRHFSVVWKARKVHSNTARSAGEPRKVKYMRESAKRVGSPFAQIEKKWKLRAKA
jgi:hypothetical protein